MLVLNLALLASTSVVNTEQAAAEMLSCVSWTELTFRKPIKKNVSQNGQSPGAMDEMWVRYLAAAAAGALCEGRSGVLEEVSAPPVSCRNRTAGGFRVAFFWLRRVFWGCMCPWCSLSYNLPLLCKPFPQQSID